MISRSVSSSWVMVGGATGRSAIFCAFWWRGSPIPHAQRRATCLYQRVTGRSGTKCLVAPVHIALTAIKSGVPPVIAPAAKPARPDAHRSQCPTQSSAGPAPTWHAPPTGASCPSPPPGRPPCRTSSAGRYRSSAGPNRRPGDGATPTRPGDRARPGSTDRSRCRARLRPAWAVLQGAATPRWVSQGVVWTSVANGVERNGNTAHALAHCAASFNVPAPR